MKGNSPLGNYFFAMKSDKVLSKNHKMLYFLHFDTKFIKNNILAIKKIKLSKFKNLHNFY